MSVTYKGCRFLSLYKARWAVFFDALGIVWEYQKDGLGEADFWLPQVHMWARAKRVFSEADDTNAQVLALETGFPVLQLDGLPAVRPYYAWEAYHVDDRIVFERMDYALTCYKNYPQREHRFYCNPEDCTLFDDTVEAVRVALSASFE